MATRPEMRTTGESRGRDRGCSLYCPGNFPTDLKTFSLKNPKSMLNGTRPPSSSCRPRNRAPVCGLAPPGGHRAQAPLGPEAGGLRLGDPHPRPPGGTPPRTKGWEAGSPLPPASPWAPHRRAPSCRRSVTTFLCSKLDHESTCTWFPTSWFTRCHETYKRKKQSFYLGPKRDYCEH